MGGPRDLLILHVLSTTMSLSLGLFPFIVAAAFDYLLRRVILNNGVGHFNGFSFDDYPLK